MFLNIWLHRFIVVVLCTGLLVLTSGPRYLVFAQNTDDINIDQALAEARNFVNLAGEALDSLPRDSFDVESILLEAFLDIDELFAWTKENITWVPYQGVLRGPQGVLMDRLGNSLDQALLMADFADGSGFDVRLAHAKLDSEIASEQLAFYKQFSLPILEPTLGEDDLDTVARVAEGVGLSPEDLQKQIEEDQKTALEDIQALQTLVEEQATELSNSLDLPEVNDKAIEEKIISALSDHWWVQIDTGDGWQDYDLILDEPIEAAETFTVDELPEELYHSVSIKVVAEKWEQDDVAESIALDYSFLPSQHIGTAFSLSFQPLGTNYDDVFEQENAQEVFIARLAETEEWLPVLNFDDKTAYQNSIMTNGNLNENPNIDSGVEDLGQSVGGLFGGGLRGDTTQEESNSHFSALWIDYDVNIPGQENQQIRRELFDLIGVAERAEEDLALDMNDDAVLERNLTLAGETQIMTQVGWLSTPFAQKLALEDAVSTIGQGIEFYEEQSEASAEDLAEQKSLPADLLSFLLARHKLSPYTEHIYLDQVNVVSNHVYGTLEDNSIQLIRAIDIVNNAVAVFPSASEDIRYVRMTQGVLDTALENYVLGNDLSDVSSDNASSLLSTSSKSDRAWQMMQDSISKDAVLNTDSQVHIQQSLDKGFSAYVPMQVPESTKVAWWRIDPTTGNTLGIGPRGWGQAMEQRTILEKVSQLGRSLIDKLACTIFVAFIHVLYTIILNVTLGSGPGATLIKSLLVAAALVPWQVLRNRCIEGLSMM